MDAGEDQVDKRREAALPRGRTLTTERRKELALERVRNMVQGSREDLDEMKSRHPPSKRSSGYTRFLESLESRLTQAAREIDEAMREKEAPTGE